MRSPYFDPKVVSAGNHLLDILLQDSLSEKDISILTQAYHMCLFRLAFLNDNQGEQEKAQNLLIAYEQDLGVGLDYFRYYLLWIAHKKESQEIIEVQKRIAQRIGRC